MNEVEIVHVLEETGALMTGHFRLSSGRHSDRFVQKFRVLEIPGVAQRFGEELAALYPEGFDVVAAPAVGAVVLGFTTALASGARSIFAERVDGLMTLRRGFRIDPHERVLVVEDVVTTGASAREVVRLCEAQGGRVVGVAALIDRGGDTRGPSALGAPLRALLEMKVDSWDPADCPLCRRDVPLQDPGSRRLA